MIDIERDKEFYNLLGQYAINQLSDEDYKKFNSVVVELTVQPGAYGIAVHCFIENERKDLDFSSPREVLKALKKFHYETTYDGSSKWNELEFTVTKENKFNSRLIWNEIKQAEIDKYNDEAELENPSYKRPKWPWEI